MAPWLIAFIGVQYLIISIAFAWNRQWDQLIMYSGYSFASIGGYMLAYK